MDLRVNGTAHRIPELWVTEPLLFTIREYLGLVGTKFSCGIGLCGACVVHVDGVSVTSCNVPTAVAEGREVRTIEGLAGKDGRLHALQQAWIAERVPQCGYCQAGQLMRAAALLAGDPQPSDADIIASMRGNLCRCGTYDRIKRAIGRVSKAEGE